MILLLQLLANGFVSGCNIALLALSFAIIYNTTRTFHIAHGAVYAVAAYICYVCLVRKGWTFVVAMSLAVLLSSGLGVLMELVVYAPLVRRKASMLVGLLSSLGLYVAVINVIALIFGNDTKLLHPGIDKVSHFGPVILTRVQIIEILTASILLPLSVVILNRTTWGKIIRAVRDNTSLATVVGINVLAVRISVFGLGSALAAVAAVLAALDVGVDPQAGMPALLTAAVALIVGGVGTYVGPVVGGFVLGLLQGSWCLANLGPLDRCNYL